VRKGGFLDNFPMHLLLGGESTTTTVIVDNPRLGRLQLTAGAAPSGSVVVISDERVRLESSLEALEGAGKRNVQWVQVDPQRLPFEDHSVGRVVVLSPPERAPEQATPASSKIETDELERVLADTGWLVEIVSAPQKHSKKQNTGGGWAKTRSYFVWPASGKGYYVTRDRIPPLWLLRSLPGSRLQLLRHQIDLLFSHLGLRALCDGIGLVVHSKIQELGIIERWTKMLDDAHCKKERTFSAKNFGLFVRTNWSALLLGANDQIIVKFPLSTEAARRMEKHTQQVNAIQADMPPAFSPLLPKIIGMGQIYGQVYWPESRLQGVPLTKLHWRPGLRKRAVESAFEFLIHMHRATAQPTRILRQHFDELVALPVSMINKAAGKLEPAFDLDDLYEALWNALGGQSLPMVRTHGDFWPGNLLISADAKLTGVLDWDRSVDRGWPLLDLLHLIVFRRKWRAIWYFGSVVTDKLMQRRLAPEEHGMVERYCASLAIEDDLWSSFVTLYWLERAAQWIETVGSEDGTWLKRNVTNPLPQIRRSLSV
jgi:aminoglycoside phosphotransferase (APT) family kinase protein